MKVPLAYWIFLALSFARVGLELGHYRTNIKGKLNRNCGRVPQFLINFLHPFDLNNWCFKKYKYVLTIKDSLLIKGCISFSPTADKTPTVERIHPTQQALWTFLGFLLPCSWQATLVHKGSFFFFLTQVINVSLQLPHRADLIITALVKIMQMKSIINCTNHLKRSAVA